jgi:hypothetical protein
VVGVARIVSRRAGREFLLEDGRALTCSGGSGLSLFQNSLAGTVPWRAAAHCFMPARLGPGKLAQFDSLRAFAPPGRL